MANFDSLVIDRVLEIVGENSDGDLLYLLNNLSNVSINTTSESKDKNFECGIKSIGNARNPFSVKYFSLLIPFFYLHENLLNSSKFFIHK